MIDIRGCCGVAGTGETLPGVLWGSLALSCVTGFLFVKNLVRPRLVRGTWTPITTADVGSWNTIAVNRSWQVSYSYLTSHPSNALLLVPTATVPAVMVLMTQHQGDNVFYWRVAGYVGLTIIVLMAVLRILSWYVFRSGRATIDNVSADSGHSAGRVAWEVAWKPVLMLILIMVLAVAVPIGVMFWQQHRTIGGEALLLAESLSVPDLKGDLADLDDGRIAAQGQVITSITDEQVTYYGFDLDDFPPPDPAGRVLVLHRYP